MATNPNAALFQRSTVSKTTTYTATILDDIILCDTSGGAWTLTLPPAASLTGKELTIKKTTSDVLALTIDGDSSETIDGATTKIMYSQYDYIKIFSTGSEWLVIDNGITTLCQKNALSGNVSAATSDITSMKIENIVVGRLYKASMSTFLSALGSNGSCNITAKHDSVEIMRCFATNSGGGSNQQHGFGNSSIFTATTTTVLFSFSESGAGGLLNATGTFSMIEDITESHTLTTIY